MSRTYKQKKYHAHKYNLRKDYKGIEKLWNCPWGLGCCGDHFGGRHTKNAKQKRRRYLRHCAKHNQDLNERLMEFWKEDSIGIRTVHVGSESYRDIGHTLFGKVSPPAGLFIIGFVVMENMEGGALLYNRNTKEFFMGSDGNISRSLGNLLDLPESALYFDMEW